MLKINCKEIELPSSVLSLFWPLYINRQISHSYFVTKVGQKQKKKIFFNDALQLLHVTSEESTTADALTRDSSITGMGNLFSRRELHETWPITEWDTPLK